MTVVRASGKDGRLRAGLQVQRTGTAAAAVAKSARVQLWFSVLTGAEVATYGAEKVAEEGIAVAPTLPSSADLAKVQQGAKVAGRGVAGASAFMNAGEIVSPDSSMSDRGHGAFGLFMLTVAPEFAIPYSVADSGISKLRYTTAEGREFEGWTGLGVASATGVIGGIRAIAEDPTLFTDFGIPP